MLFSEKITKYRKTQNVFLLTAHMFIRAFNLTSRTRSVAVRQEYQQKTAATFHTY